MCGSDIKQAAVITTASTALTSLRNHCSVGMMAHSDVRRYQRRDSVPRILGPRSLPVPRTKTSHDTSQITTSQTRTSHFTHTLKISREAYNYW